MFRYKHIRDIYFTEAGDFRLGPDGDLEETTNYQYRGLIQKVLTKVASQKGEWALHPEMGLGLSDFLGKPNSALLGAQLRARVMSELIRDGTIKPADLKVFVFPTSETSLAIVIEINPPGVPERVKLAFSYHTNDNRITPRNL